MPAIQAARGGEVLLIFFFFYKDVAVWYVNAFEKSNNFLFGTALLCFVVFLQYSSDSPQGPYVSVLFLPSLRNPSLPSLLSESLQDRLNQT